MAYQKIIYEQLKNYLYVLYGITDEDHDSLQTHTLLSFRAISLTLFHAVLNQYRFRDVNYTALTDSEIILHLLYEDAGEIIPSPGQVSLSLVLKILEPRLQRVLHSTDSEFQELVADMNSHFEKHMKVPLQSCINIPVLRELEWDDLPNNLFSLTPYS